MRIPKLIFDDGTPLCLPRWARDEIVRLRLENDDLLREHESPDQRDLLESVENVRQELDRYCKVRG